MSRVVIDSNSLQAHQHLRAVRSGQTRCRLTSFVRKIEGLGHSVAFEESLDPSDGLKNADLLIVPTRLPQHPIDPFLKGIHQFVLGGGSLFLMSNHSRVPSRPRMWHLTEQDAKLARLFGIVVMEACFRSDRYPEYTIVHNAGAKNHPLLNGKTGQRIVNKVVINNGCAIDRNSTGTPVLLLPEDAVDIGPNCCRPHGNAFCWARETDGGRVLVTGDSGFVGEPNLPGSGPGLFAHEHGDNILFIENAVSWLLAPPNRQCT